MASSPGIFANIGALGHGDRGFVAESVFAVLRRRRSLAARCGADVSSRRMLLAALVVVFGWNRRQLEPVLRASEADWLAGEVRRFDPATPA